MSSVQRLVLVHFSAHRKRFLWDRGFIQGLFRGYLGGVRGCQGGLRVHFVSEMVQVELESGRVSAPASVLGGLRNWQRSFAARASFTSARLWRRKLNLKAKLESSL